MARRAKIIKGKKQVDALKHDKATRKNLATAELASVAERMEEIDPVGPQRYARARPLPKGVVRERDLDLDPQIVWNGARIRLSPDQVRQLQDKGQVEIGDAQLVWRGKDRQDWSDLVVQAPQIYVQYEEAGMNLRYRVELSQTERAELTALLSGGKHAPRKLKRAQVLLAADAGVGDEEIARSVGVGGSTVSRTKRRFVLGQPAGGARRAAAAGGETKALRQGGGPAGRHRLFQPTRRAGALDAGASGG